MVRTITYILGAWFVVAGSCAFAGTTVRVSVGPGGVQGNLASTSVGAISADGRYVAFDSLATNLVPGDTNRFPDVFLRDRTTGKTERISVSTGGAQGNDFSDNAQISANGRWVAFLSGASTLVPGDTNNSDDAFVRDRQTGTTRRVSVRTGGAQANGAVGSVEISGNGRFVAFTSGATNLVDGDTNGVFDLFIHDRTTGTTSRVNVGPRGVQCLKGGSGGAMSFDARYIAFNSSCSNLIVGGTNGQVHSFVRDRQTGTNELVSRSSTGVQGNKGSTAHDLSADGRFVVISSSATNLVPDTNGEFDVFVRDRTAKKTQRVSVGRGGVQGNSSSGLGAISANGRFVVFTSVAANLVAGDTNGQSDIFLHDRQTRVTRRVSVATNGAQADIGSSFNGISANGKVVVFTSFATNLVPRDTNRVYDVFVHTP